MKYLKYKYLLAIILGCLLSGCFDLTEEVFDRVDSGVYYQDENSVKSAVATIYSTGATSYAEYFWYMQEFPADQVTWRVWNGGQWGYDEGEKFVFSIQNWTPDAKIIRSAWEKAWTTIGLCNTLLADLGKLTPADLKMTEESLKAYEGEVRTLRAWAYYNIFEIWGGALPLNIEPATVDGELPPTADPDFDTSCKKIYDFIATELDACYEGMAENQVNRMNKAVNRMIKARLLLNAEVFIKENHYSECAELCRKIISGEYGKYDLAKDYRDIYSINNTECPEVIMAFACEDGKLNMGWMRMTFYPYNIWDYFGGTYSQSGWNCTCLVPSYDNQGTVNELGGTQGAACFLDAPYSDKLGAVYERFDDRDIRKKNYTYDKKNGYSGIFLKGTVKANYGKGEALKADADRDGQDLAYVDQVGTFMNLGRNLETVMSPRWGETNSGLRLVKYPVYPTSAGIDFQNIDEVEFRLSEVYYMLAECEMRSGQADKAKDLVNSVRQRYFSAGDWADVKDRPGRGFTTFDMDWMLSQWGVEFLNEGRRRRTDLRRFDKFTQGQWWFFGRASDDGGVYPAKRDRKYEWYPLPSSALLVNQGLIQNPNYK